LRGPHPSFEQVTLLLTPAAAAPEPSTLWLLGLDLAGISFMRRRKQIFP